MRYLHHCGPGLLVSVDRVFVFAGAASVMAPAVANPLLLGYKALYRTLLEDSKRGVAQAMRVFVDEANHPVLVSPCGVSLSPCPAVACQRLMHVVSVELL